MIRFPWLAMAFGLGLPTAAAAAAGDDKPILVPPYEATPCWVSVFDGKGFQPPAARLNGPTFVENSIMEPVLTPDLRNVGGQDFIDRIDSLIVGPRGRVTVFDQPNFSGNRRSFGPGEKVPDLSVHGFDNRIESIRMNCE